MTSLSPLPSDFTLQMQALLGAQFDGFQVALAGPAPTSIHYNPLKSFKHSADQEVIAWSPHGAYLPSRPSFTLDPAFHAGAYYVQEASSMAVAYAARSLCPWDRPLRVLDLCAAPGGKTTLLASILPPGSWLLANEVIKSRYRTLRYNIDKWGHPHIISSQQDVADFAGLNGFFDLVLVDAPCSGEGLFRKDLHAREEWSLEHVELCAGRQKRILAAAAPLLAPEGVLLYSTCTYNRQENDDNARWVEETFELEYCPFHPPDNWQFETRERGYQIYPHRVKGEGFYLAAFRKMGGEKRFNKRSSAFKKLQSVPKRQIDLAHTWISPSHEVEWYNNANGVWRGIPAYLADDARVLSEHLRRLEAGFVLGTLKGKSIVPSPQWALHVNCPEQLSRFELGHDEALRYLRKETPELTGLPKGWSLMTYAGLGLGWVKGLGNRYNNYYPKEWRIRMAAKK